MQPAPSARFWLGAGLVLLAAASPALAQTERPKRRPQPPPAAKPADTDTDNVMENATGAAAPGPPAASLPSLRPAPPPLVLRSAVQSRWSRTPTIARSTAGQCRATCAEQRGACASAVAANVDPTSCDQGWTQCLSTCSGLSYQRGP